MLCTNALKPLGMAWGETGIPCGETGMDGAEVGEIGAAGRPANVGVEGIPASGNAVLIPAGMLPKLARLEGGVAGSAAGTAGIVGSEEGGADIDGGLISGLGMAEPGGDSL
ncbi:MAG: hypothetical protein SFU86_12115 [Pirellulaceae bacterium]|nr:hypothetical protein [Pirellulaceae bacterium]